MAPRRTRRISLRSGGLCRCRAAAIRTAIPSATRSIGRPLGNRRTICGAPMNSAFAKMDMDALAVQFADVLASPQLSACAESLMEEIHSGRTPVPDDYSHFKRLIYERAGLIPPPAADTATH